MINSMRFVRLLSFYAISFLAFSSYAVDEDTHPLATFSDYKTMKEGIKEYLALRANRDNDDKDHSQFWRRERVFGRIHIYLYNHPESLIDLEKDLPQSEMEILMNSLKLDKTKTGNAYYLKYMKSKVEKDYTRPIDRKYYLIENIVRHGMRMHETLDLINYVEKTYPEPGYDILFKKHPFFEKVYPMFKDAVQYNVSLFDELRNISADEMRGWKINTFSYAKEKLKQGVLKPREEYDNTLSVEDDDSSYRFNSTLFVEDFIKVYKSKDTVKIQKKLNPELLFKLFQTISERGGKYDYLAEKTVKTIVACMDFYRTGEYSIGPQPSPQNGIMSVQTVIEDAEGRIRYIFTFSNGLKDHDDYKIKSYEYYQPWTFHLAKLVYGRNNDPAYLTATEIYANQAMKELLNTAVREKYEIDFSHVFRDEFGDDYYNSPRVPFSVYDLRNARFYDDTLWNNYVFDEDFPIHPESKLLIDAIGNMTRSNSDLFYPVPMGIFLIPE